MGSLTLAAGSVAYLDANCIIYSVEQIQPYAALWQPLWQRASAGDLRLLTSSLTLLEVLVGPLQVGDGALEATFRRLLQQSTDLQLVPISDAILDRAAHIRAATRLRTPDAIHAATAIGENCTQMLTNDAAFRRVPGLSVIVLAEHASP